MTADRPTRSQSIASVAANIPLCREHYKLVLKVAEFAPTEPGQFIQIACHDLETGESAVAEWDWAPGKRLAVADDDLRHPVAMLRRPFSLAGRRDTSDGAELDIIHRVVGVGTTWLGQLKVGDEVGILGPLGNRFVLPKEGQTAVLVGGGVGIPPTLYLAQRLKGRRGVAFCGATKKELLPLRLMDVAPPVEGGEPTFCLGEFADCGIRSVVTTDDGSYGMSGFVTQALEAFLDRQGEGSGLIVYTCGPEPMMKRVADIAARRGLACQVAVERAMACGMGTCQSCCIRVKVPMRPDGRDWVYRLACTDGPIFAGDQLLW